jgi:hypothetical protein
MERRSTIEKTVGSEMPETPGLKLPQEKISTATRKRLSPFLRARPLDRKQK